jgi:hypothetical protein
MRIRAIAEQRSRFRAESRIVADELLDIILKRLDAVPENQQVPAITMLVSELNAITRKSSSEKY